jgi:hypothetical protein
MLCSWLIHLLLLHGRRAMPCHPSLCTVVDCTQQSGAALTFLVHLLKDAQPTWTVPMYVEAYVL